MSADTITVTIRIAPWLRLALAFLRIYVRATGRMPSRRLFDWLCHHGLSAV